MDELIDIKDQLEIKTEKILGGILTVVRHATGISHQSQIAGPKNTILVSHLYVSDHTYKVTYLHLDKDGQLTTALHENSGVLPNLFTGTKGEIWCRLTDTTSDKELEIIAPLLNRENYTKPKGRRPFAGDFIGLAGEVAVFHNDDIFSANNPDKLLKVQLKKGKASVKLGKLPLPSQNKVLIDPDGLLQLLAREGELLVHRVSDLNGEITLERKIPLENFNSFELLDLSADNDSQILFSRDAQVLLGTLTPDGKVKQRLLFENTSDIFSLWAPVHLENDISLLRFTFERGNGWLINQGEKLIDGFIHDGCEGYRSVVNDRMIHIPCNDLILSGITKVNSCDYCACIYPRNDQRKALDLFVVHQSAVS